MADCARLIEIAKLFTKLGFTAFGGPAVHVGMMEDEVVHRRKWIDRQHFLDLIAAINFIPGPNSTQLAVHLGLIRAGIPGLIVAGVCFITPAVLIILPLAWLYTTYGQMPAVGGVLRGISAVVIAVIAVAMVRLCRTAFSKPLYIAIAIATAAGGYLLRDVRAVPIELVLLAIAALVGWFAGRMQTVTSSSLALPLLGRRGMPLWDRLRAIPSCRTIAESLRPVAAHRPSADLISPAAVDAAAESLKASPAGKVIGLSLLSAPMTAASAGLLTMFLAFLRIGATLFGSGYLLVAYMQAGLVDRAHLLTQQQMQDSIAIGQVTPGPLLTTATFAGYVIGRLTLHGGVMLGVIGAVLATAAIFSPSFFLVALLGRFLPKIRAMPAARGALDGMNAAVVAMIFLVLVKLAAVNLRDGWSIGLATAGAILMFAWNVNATWIIAGAGLVGWLVYR